VSVLEFHRQLRDVAEDQLSLAAVHYLRAHYQEAIDIYKRLVLQNKELMALHVCNTNSFNIQKSIKQPSLVMRN
jgi:hypothetical protein